MTALVNAFIAVTSQTGKGFTTLYQTRARHDELKVSEAETLGWFPQETIIFNWRAFTASRKSTFLLKESCLHEWLVFGQADHGKQMGGES